jgi:anti-sigma-K factor RskA
MRMRQSLADIEAAFVEELEEDRERAERMQRRAVKRTRKRRVEREQKLGSMRFGLVLTVIIATAVVVTIAMFQALYIVMG